MDRNDAAQLAALFVQDHRSTTQTMKLTIAQAHRLSLALTAVAKGFPNGEAKPVSVIRSAAGKLKVARNMRRLRDALEPVEAELIKERDRLVEEEKAERPDAKDLSPARASQLNKFVRELNAESVNVDIDTLAEGDLDLDKFEGEEAMQALSVLDGVVLS